MQTFRRAALALALIAAPALAQGWDPAPWVEDVQTMRAAFLTKYANREWLEQARGMTVAAMFDRIEARMRTAGSDAAARALLDRAVRGIGDGHVDLEWPVAAAQPAGAPPSPPIDADGLCRAIGYRDRGDAGVAGALPGAVALDATVLPAGTVTVGGTKLGYVRIAEFSPEAFPRLCTDAVAALKIAPGKPCDDGCQARIVTRAYAGLTADYERSLRRLKGAGAAVVMIDLTGNGGGGDWTEAAARSLTAKRLRSADAGFVRGPHWAKQWADTAAQLRGFAKRASRADRARLLALAAQADAARVEAETPCDPGTGCSWLGRGRYATGLLGDDAEAAFIDRGPWSPYVFNATQHHYTTGTWTGPVLVLVDQETWSAAEEFAALLQDNDAATIVGGRTGGAGCGHTWGGTPTTLPNSKAVLSLPDCVRFRRDGSNEVAGVIPDVAIGWRANDGIALKTRLLTAALPAAVATARAR